MFHAALLLALCLQAGDWPNWRGPQHDGVSREAGWSSTGREEDLWRRDVGLGHSSVSVVGDKLYTFGFDAAGEVDVVWCLDAETGAKIWNYTYAATLDAVGHGGGTHTTPTVAGGHVYVTNRKGGLHCLDAETGTVAWVVDLTKVLAIEPNEYGYGGSPLVLGDRIFVNAGKIAALEKATGELAWQTSDHLAMYSTPTPFEMEGETRIASFTKEGLYVLARGTGAELYHHPWRKGKVTVNASTPVPVGERMFLSSGYSHGCTLLSFEKDTVEAVWENKAMRTELSGAVHYDGHLYGFDGSKLKCIGLDGEEKWRKRGLGQGALMASDGRLIVMSEKGDLVIARATPKKYEELSKARVMDGGACWTTPTLAGGRIYCRSGQGVLVARDHRK